MYRLFFLSFLFASVVLPAANGGKDPKPGLVIAPIEATVVTGECGYLLQLSDGQLLQPQNLPQAFCKEGKKVAVVLDELKNANSSPCHADKEVHIAEIRVYEKSQTSRAKFGSGQGGRAHWKYSCFPKK